MFKKLLAALSLMLSLVYSASSSATLLTQDIIFYGEVEGSITYDTSLVDEFGLISSWDSLDFLGYTFDSSDAFGLIMEVDVTDLFSGLTSLFFDATDTTGTIDFQVFYDATDSFWNAIVYDYYYYDGSSFSLGTASEVIAAVADVPEPSIGLLMLTGVFALALRRKAK